MSKGKPSHHKNRAAGGAIGPEGPASVNGETQPDQNGTKQRDKPSQADLLVGLVLDQSPYLFHEPGGVGFVRVKVGTHYETMRIRSMAFRNWMTCVWQQRYMSTIGKTPLEQALFNLDAKALVKGPEEIVYHRMGQHKDTVYVDLGRPDWQFVEIDKHGYRLTQECPVPFHRPPSMQALPLPEEGGTLEELWSFFNVQEAYPRVLLLAFLVQCCLCKGPFPVLILGGPQGSGKSWVGWLLQMVIDPKKGKLRADPDTLEDLAVGAHNAWLLVFDNLSGGLSRRLADGLCRLSTEGSFARRTRYTDDEETIMEATRPVVLTSIDDLTKHADLTDRAILLDLKPIPESKKIHPSELREEFTNAWPRMLGTLFSAVSHAIRELPHVRLDRMQRMADFHRLGVALERGEKLDDGIFTLAYEANIAEAKARSGEQSPLWDAIHALLDCNEGSVEEPAGELLKLLAEKADDGDRKSRDWPVNGQSLSRGLTRLVPALRGAGIEFHRPPKRGKSGSRSLRLTRIKTDETANEDG